MITISNLKVTSYVFFFCNLSLFRLCLKRKEVVRNEKEERKNIKASLPSKLIPLSDAKIAFEGRIDSQRKSGHVELLIPEGTTYS